MINGWRSKASTLLGGGEDNGPSATVSWGGLRRTYPCLKCYTTVDAALKRECAFLANEWTTLSYNDFVVDRADVEEISPHGTVNWTRVLKILIVKPRDFEMYFAYWW